MEQELQNVLQKYVGMIITETVKTKICKDISTILEKYNLHYRIVVEEI